MAYLAAVGKHFSDSGPEDCWVESGIYSENTKNNMIKGKLYNRSIRAPKPIF